MDELLAEVAAPSPSLDALVLLSPPHLATAAAQLLAAANPDIALILAHDLAGLDAALTMREGPRVRLIAICFGQVVPAALLVRCGAGAVNLHPATPEYPGSGALHLALYEGAASFGATAHLMQLPVDSGPILAVERFAIPAGIGHRSLSDLALGAVLNLLKRLAPALTGELPPPCGESWAGRPHRLADVMALAKLTPYMPADEVRRRWRAFRDGPESPLYMDFQGLPLHYRAPGRIQGWFDGIQDGHAHGWAYDPAGGPVRLRLVVNDATGMEALATLPRPDVAAAGHGDGQCGFAIPLEGLLPAEGQARIDILLPDDEWRRLPGAPRVL
ncbi:formyltransferase family protein [Niveispirillum sp. BGYR6]|uniref:formyltransferase family protein n=1 Tax=Niveispirillum sp. BGYR6 TaxID=2971249 RepID=UPI0022B95665|nr:formyltransferase family protein [Niveispirillum sp. BGYR6]MDG5495051.1 formyltransferase family protein [Niveispirillum sp. BGYR6]